MKEKQLLLSALFVVLCCLNLLAQTTTQVPAVLTIESASERLVEKNLLVEAARLEISAGKAQVVAAELRPRPTLNVSAENLRVAGTTPFGRLYETGATVQQPIELGGQRKSRIEVAERTVSVAEAKLEGVLKRRLSELRTTFFEGLFAQALKILEEQNRQNFDDLLRFSEVKFREGDLSEGDLIKVRLERVRYNSTVANARLRLTQAKIKLLQLIGDTDFSRVDDLELRQPFEFMEIDLNLLALKQGSISARPEVKIAEAELSRAQTVLKSERARSRGEIVPFAGYRRVGIDNTVLAGVSVPLPFGNRNNAAIAQAEADFQIAQNARQFAENRTLAEVESAFRTFESAKEQLKAFEVGVLRQADESRDITILAYREGAAQLIAVLDAQRTRSEIRITYYQALVNYYTSVFHLELVTGQDLWK